MFSFLIVRCVCVGNHLTRIHSVCVGCRYVQCFNTDAGVIVAPGTLFTSLWFHNICTMNPFTCIHCIMWPQWRTFAAYCAAPMPECTPNMTCRPPLCSSGWYWDHLCPAGIVLRIKSRDPAAAAIAVGSVDTTNASAPPCSVTVTNGWRAVQDPEFDCQHFQIFYSFHWIYVWVEI